MKTASGEGQPAPARLPTLLICFCLTSLIWLVFGQCLAHDFVAYDDQNYVYENPLISAGLTWHGFIAAFTQPHARNWHPLTTLSHMLDCQLFGLNPAGHHLTNLVFHTAATLLLFTFLRQSTQRLWLSAFVAGVFAIHPLRVESVAWVAERKDVLSAFFFMLTLHAYRRYAAAPTRLRYTYVAFAFALGLMSKPMLVTTPFLLLLLDYWPLLGRFNQRATGRLQLCLEKLPLVVLSLLTGVATILAQKPTVSYGEHIGLLTRLANATVGYMTYIGQMLWPAKLSVFYPQLPHPPTVLLLMITVLVLLTAAAIWLHNTYPYLVVGWIWYVVSLLPVLGLVPVGLQAHADRYTYLPQIGLYIGLTWLAFDLAKRNLVRERILAFTALLSLAVLSWVAHAQAATWRNTETLWLHAAVVSPANEVAHYNLALIAAKRGDIDGAIFHYEQALRACGDAESASHLSPAMLHNALGVALANKGLPEAAAIHYRKAVELRPDFADAHTNLASFLVTTGRVEQGLDEYKQASSIPPEDAESHLRVAAALERIGRKGEAIEEYQRAAELSRARR